MTIHLSILIFWPLAMAVIGAFMPRRIAPVFALIGALVPLGYAVLMLFDFETGGGLQYVTDDLWIADLGVHYKLGVDGLNLWLIALTGLLFAASALWLTLRPPVRASQFSLHFGIAETAVLGAFLAQDLALFVLFFDLMLVPFYFLVGIWGGQDRVAAAIKMVVYTLVGSLLMLAAAGATAVLSARGGADLSFAFSDLAANRMPESTQKWIFIAFGLAFLIKMPAFPFHGWMPDAYRAMPLPALAVFSGVVSKVAAYGFLKIALPLFPAAAHDFQVVLLVFAVVSILYGSVMAFTQTNVRLILGYSSMAQLGFITLGLFAADNAAAGAQGALLQAVNHGLVVAPMFFVVALLAERSAGSEDIRDMGGIAFRAPVLAGLFLVAALATLAMPGSANFAGEFLILLGTFDSKMVFSFIASIGVVLASVYALRMYIRTMHNRTGRGRHLVRDVDPRRDRAGAADPRDRGVRPVSAGGARQRGARREGRDEAGAAGRRRRGPGGGPAVIALFAQAKVSGPPIDWEAIAPLVALTTAACVVLLVGLARAPFIRTRAVPLLTVVGLGTTIGLCIWQWGENESIVSNALAMDDFTRLLTLFFCVAGIATVGLSWRSAAAAEAGEGEYYALMLASILGMVILVAAENFVVLFVGFELLSIPLYVLCATHMRREQSLESGLKYLIIGSVGSATLLYGLALLYGATGSTDYSGVAAAAAEVGDDALFLTGIALVVAGLAFKASVAPFHQWTPDVYEGAPTPITAFMAVATKAAAFGVLLRLFDVALIGAASTWAPALATLAAVTIVIGNVGALGQSSLKRMLAYSSVAQAGYMLVGVVVSTRLGVQATIFYLGAYLVMNIAAFAVIAVRERETDTGDDISSLYGLGAARPALAWPMTIAMLSLAGFPATAGFFGKLYLIQAAVDNEYAWLGVAIVLGSAISLVYYLRVVAAVWMRSPSEATERVRLGSSAPRPVIAGGSPEADEPEEGSREPVDVSAQRTAAAESAAEPPRGIRDAPAGGRVRHARVRRRSRSPWGSTPIRCSTSPATRARRSPRSSEPRCRRRRGRRRVARGAVTAAWLGRGGGSLSVEARALTARLSTERCDAAETRSGKPAPHAHLPTDAGNKTPSPRCNAVTAPEPGEGSPAPATGGRTFRTPA